MKNFFIFCFTIIGLTSIRSQDKNSDSTAYTDKIFFAAQQQPEFQGGASEWISNHVIYPKQASDSNIQGTVYLSFIIEKDGAVSDIKVLKGVQGGISLDNEAVRVVSTMPKWTPGLENGHIVRVSMTLPINFKLIDNIDTVKAYSYDKVQVKPVFPGNIEEWIAFNSVYPKMASQSNKLDTVDIAFIVEENGSLSHIEVVRGQDKYLNAEAVNVVSGMPKWTPGMQNGQIVKVLCMIPIRFDPLDTDCNNKIYTLVQVPPRFPEDVNLWFTNHIIYPPEAKNANIQDSVYISFVVEKDGSVSKVHIKRGMNKYLNDEGIRVASNMPKWIPGKENGQPVRVFYTLPINFTLSDSASNNKIYNAVQVQPKFPENINTWLTRHIIYPKGAQKANIQGTVYISFVIELDGSVSEVRVLRGANDYLDQEAIRVVSSMPKWIPGKESGQPVRVQFMVPIHFILN